MNNITFVYFVILFLSFQCSLFAESLKTSISKGFEPHNINYNNDLYKLYYWLLPNISKNQLNKDSLQRVISLLISNHNFPNLEKINETILQNDNFLSIEDKYLLINYITNFTPFAQTYVDTYNISTQDFNQIIQKAKEYNTLPQHFIMHVKQEYTLYNILHKEINKENYNKVAKQIHKIQSTDEKNILYTRLYLNGYNKYRKYYQITKAKALDNELSLHDKISYHKKHKNYREISKYIRKLPPTLNYGDLWWENHQVTILELAQNGFAKYAYLLLEKMYLSRSHPNFARKEMLSGTLALFLNKPTKAFEHFHNVYDTTNYNDEKIQSAYFIAQSYNNLGNEEAYKYWLSVASQYPTMFYGIIAFEELNDIPDANIMGSDDYMKKIWKQNAAERRKILIQRINGYKIINFKNTEYKFEDLPPHIKEMIGIAKLLNAEDYTQYAKDFIISAGRQIVQPSMFTPLIKEVCDKFNKYICADLKHIAMRNGYLDKTIFPKLESNAVNEEIKNHHFALLHGIIKQESNFKEVIRSRVGARGLMQVMPATARFICHTHKIPFSQRKLNFDPNYNINLGTLYINDLLKRYKGSYVLALMAYNAGYGSVGKWENAYSRPQNTAEMLVFLELIPYKETRKYVKNIIQNQAIYEYYLAQN